MNAPNRNRMMKATVHLAACFSAAALIAAAAAGCTDSAARPAADARGSQSESGPTSRKPEVRGQKSEVRGQQPEGRGQRSEVRGQKSEHGIGNPQSAIRNPQSSPPPAIGPPTTDNGQRPQPVYRPADNRPSHDDDRLAALGIRKYESKRLRLYTDVDPDAARGLPAIIDQAHTAWEDYFGKLPPDRDGAEFQVTGYIMADAELFRREGLLPGNLPEFHNGRHRGYEFWMHDQSAGYYRRHLMIHEATHCFMYAVRDRGFPGWYMEGMAELFGTHRIDDGRARFRVMPHDEGEFVGFGRITMVRQAFRQGRGLTVREVTALRGNDYLSDEAYAWSWALCKFFDAHPRFRDEFRKLGRIPTSAEFVAAFRQSVLERHPHLETEWAVFASGLEYGYDMDRAVIDFQPGRPLAAGSAAVQLQLETDRGWQSSGVQIEKGRRYAVTASGRFTLAQKPRPWVSEPQGVSIVYADGRPLGMLLAAVHDHDESAEDGTRLPSMLDVIPAGRGTAFTAQFTGTLYFRVNDFWSDLANNTGRVQVRIRQVRGH